jgi:hypothetical protein
LRIKGTGSGQIECGAVLGDSQNKIRFFQKLKTYKVKVAFYLTRNMFSVGWQFLGCILECRHFRNLNKIEKLTVDIRQTHRSSGPVKQDRSHLSPCNLSERGFDHKAG